MPRSGELFATCVRLHKSRPSMGTNMAGSLAPTHDHTAPIDCSLFRRNYSGNRFIYCKLSQRAGGFVIGVNLNPDKRCNFDCAYCEVDRTSCESTSTVDVDVLNVELESMLSLLHHQRQEELGYPEEAMEIFPFKEVALSGDGEPTLCLNFRDVIFTIVHRRASSRLPFFKIVLLTNASHLHRLEVREGLALLHRRDEVWAKLDVGTQGYMDIVNGGDAKLSVVLKNIRELALKRPVVIQSLFCSVKGEEPSHSEIVAYARNLRELRSSGAQIPLVQIYSVRRPPAKGTCRHLPLKSLSQIARIVRSISGLHTEIF